MMVAGDITAAATVPGPESRPGVAARTTNRCLHDGCRQPVPVHDGPGRPRLYCSERCRAIAFLERSIEAAANGFRRLQADRMSRGLEQLGTGIPVLQWVGSEVADFGRAIEAMIDELRTISARSRQPRAGSQEGAAALYGLVKLLDGLREAIDPARPPPRLAHALARLGSVTSFDETPRVETPEEVASRAGSGAGPGTPTQSDLFEADLREAIDGLACARSALRDAADACMPKSDRTPLEREKEIAELLSKASGDCVDPVSAMAKAVSHSQLCIRSDLHRVEPVIPGAGAGPGIFLAIVT